MFSTDDLDHAPCGIIFFSETGIIEKVNASLVEYLGYTAKAELMGKPVEQLFTIAGRIFYQTHFFPLLRISNVANEIFFTLRKKDGGELPVICNSIRKETGGKLIIQCVIFPVTERKKYETELLNARKQAEAALENNRYLIEAQHELEKQNRLGDRQLSKLNQANSDILQFNKVLTHDLQEPLRKIAIFSDRVLTDAGNLLSDKSHLSLQKIQAEYLRLRQLILNLEQYIHLSSQHGEMTRCNLEAIRDRAFLQVFGHNPGRVQLTASILPVLDGHESQLELLFFNLFENCDRFRSPSRELAIDIACSAVQQNSFRSSKGNYRYVDFVKITVRDNGTGFNQKYSKQVFRLQAKLNANRVGFGFGLAFCEKIVNNHYGSISANSVEGDGTSITILLPLFQDGEEEVTV